MITCTYSCLVKFLTRCVGFLWNYSRCTFFFRDANKMQIILHYSKGISLRCLSRELNRALHHPPIQMDQDRKTCCVTDDDVVGST